MSSSIWRRCEKSAPTEADAIEKQVSDRLERYISEYLRQGRLTDADRQTIEDSIALMEPRH